MRAGSNILNPLRYPIAHNELEAKFCPAFMVSAIALRRKAGIHEFTDEFVRSAPVQEMMAKVERILDPEIEAKGFEKIRSTVEVDLEDGRRLVEHADERYRGGPDRPFTRDELHEKFTDCASLVLPQSGIEETCDDCRIDRAGPRCHRSRTQSDTRTIRTPNTRDRCGAMSLAWISVAALVLAVILSCTTTINVGVLSLALALIVGVYLGGMSADAVLEGFPVALFVTLLGVTLLFSIAECNGTLARLTSACRAPLPRARGRRCRSCSS